VPTVRWQSKLVRGFRVDPLDAERKRLLQLGVGLAGPAEGQPGVGQYLVDVRQLAVAFSPDGKTLATGGVNGAKLWDVDNGEERATLTGHTEQVNSVAFSPNGQRLTSGGDDRTVRLWKVPK
jgi:WD40 repeat protein